jgi:hypothetical protein
LVLAAVPFKRGGRSCVCGSAVRGVVRPRARRDKAAITGIALFAT